MHKLAHKTVEHRRVVIYGIKVIGAGPALLALIGREVSAAGLTQGGEAQAARHNNGAIRGGAETG
jgi:hypothetical protein